MTVITGWILAVAAFILAAALWSGFFGPDMSLPVGAFAGFFTWKYFDDKYKKDLAALLKPPPEVWPLPMPEAWTCLKETLAGAHVQSGASGVTNWRIQQEDTTKGTLQAQINFSQSLGDPNQPKIVSRSVTLNAQLIPEGDNTRVEIEYQIFSPSGTGIVESVMKTTQASLKHQIATRKGA
jgi:hypothetical protein